MGKITLVVLVLLVGFGVYWFYWEEGGANAPITINYDISVTALEKQGTGFVRWDVGGNLDLCATQNKAKIETKINVKKQGKKIADIEFGGILRLDTKELFLMLPDSKIYCEKEFDFVPLSETEKPESRKYDWSEDFELALDSQWFGSGNEKYYAQKQIPKSKEWKERIKQSPNSKVELWFTSDTKLGSRYIKGLNKLFRIDMDLEKELKGINPGIKASSKKKSSDDKRPQLGKSDLPYFPIPLKIYVDESGADPKNPSSRYHVRATIAAKEFSRKKIQKSEFEIPSEYKKVSFDKFMQEVMAKMMSIAMSQMIR